MAMRRRRDPRLADCTVDGAAGRRSDSRRMRGRASGTRSPSRRSTRRPSARPPVPFVEVLARAFFRSRADSQFVLPRVGLSDLYTDDARRFVERRGGRVWIHAQAAALEVHDGAVRASSCATAAGSPPTPASRPCRRRRWRTSCRQSCARSRRSRGSTGSRRRRSCAPPVVRPTRAARRLRRPARHHHAVGLQPHTPPRRGRSGAVRERRHQRRARRRRVGYRSRDGEVLADLRAVLPAAVPARLERSVVVKEKHATVSPTPAAERLRPPAGRRSAASCSPATGPRPGCRRRSRAPS